MDLLLTLCIAPLIVPLMMAIAVLIRLNSPGPVLFAHERIGRHGKRFKVWKFRTMHRDAERRLREYLDSDPALLAEWEADQKLRNDPRIHWIGRLLRKTSLDELPQIWNVVCGEMSLVGPRPIVTQEIEKYAQYYEEDVKVLPGVTGLWQISGRNNTTYDERVQYDAYYVKNWSPWLDVYILGATVRVVLLGEGAY